MQEDNEILNKKDCSFCSQFKWNRMPSSYIKQSGIENRILKQSDNFVSIPSISPIAEGHVMILPKYHVSSMVQIETNHRNELLHFVRKIFALVQKIYGNIAVTEHGVGLGKTGGCGVTHAHLHIFPAKQSTSRTILSELFETFLVNGPYDLEYIIEAGDIRKSYLCYGYDLDELIISYQEDIPSQYLRKLIAKLTFKTDWDWKEMYGWDDFVKTYETLNTNVIR